VLTMRERDTLCSVPLLLCAAHRRLQFPHHARCLCPCPETEVQMPLPLAVPDVDVLKISNDDAAFILGKNGKTSASPPSPPRSPMS